MSKEKLTQQQQEPQMGDDSFVTLEKPKNFKGTLWKLAIYMKKYIPAVIVVFILAIASTTLAVIGPKILGQATTALFEGIIAKFTGTGGIDFTAIGKILMTLSLLYIFSAIMYYFESLIMATVSNKLSYTMRLDISKKINALPLSYFDKTSYGDVLSRITNDVDTISQTLNQSLSELVASTATVIGIIIIMFTINPFMTIVALLILPISAAILRAVIKRSQPSFRKQQKFLGEVNGYVEEIYSGQQIIRAFNKEEESIETFNGINDKLYNSALKSNFLSNLMQPLMNFIGNLGYIAVCILGGFLTLNGTIKIGDIQAFIQYVRQFNHPIMQIANISGQLQQTAAASERVFEFLNESEYIPDPENPIELDEIEPIKGEITFDHVKFGYDKDKIIINDFSQEIKASQTVAIVGPTGAGKSTIVKLLMRFYDVNSGAILLDGHNIKDFHRYDLRSTFGMVLQDTWLYNASIKENIRYGNLNATDEEVYEAAREAQADHFIRTLPDGYDMIINEEADNISQGQKQLLTIARTLIADPKVLILDEATSSVDTRTEVLIQKGINTLIKGRTCFIIAHRLSTIRDADLILVMAKGDIIETGTHKELLEQNGFYADLYRSQYESEAGLAN